MAWGSRCIYRVHVHDFEYVREWGARAGGEEGRRVHILRVSPRYVKSGRLACARTVVGTDNVIGDSRPIMASEDFGYMLQARPGAYLLLGNGEGGVGGCSLHNPSYDFNDEILTLGADFWVALVESELTV